MDNAVKSKDGFIVWTVLYKCLNKKDIICNLPFAICHLQLYIRYVYNIFTFADVQHAVACLTARRYPSRSGIEEAPPVPVAVVWLVGVSEKNKLRASRGGMSLKGVRAPLNTLSVSVEQERFYSLKVEKAFLRITRLPVVVVPRDGYEGYVGIQSSQSIGVRGQIAQMYNQVNSGNLPIHRLNHSGKNSVRIGKNKNFHCVNASAFAYSVIMAKEMPVNISASFLSRYIMEVDGMGIDKRDIENAAKMDDEAFKKQLLAMAAQNGINPAALEAMLGNVSDVKKALSSLNDKDLKKVTDMVNNGNADKVLKNFKKR